MKKVILFLGIIMIFRGLYAQDWQWKNPLPQGNSLFSVHFPGNLTGYAVGDNGTILKTIDGGVTWMALSSGTRQTLYSVFFVNQLSGYAVGYKIILKTSDGGITWQAFNGSSNYSLRSVCFTDSVTGIAVGYGVILRTTDGGNSWVESSSGSSIGTLNSVSFADKRTGYAAGNNSKILKTVDGGATWNFISQDNINSADFSGIHFYDSLSGCVSGRYEITNPFSYKRIVLKTTDGGVTWDTIMKGNDGYLSAIFCADQNTIIAAGQVRLGQWTAYATLYRTNNGGLSWETTEISSCQELNSLFFNNKNNGCAVGYGGTIVTTPDGGQNWAPSSAGSSQYLSAMCFTSKTTGYAAGACGTILKTQDEGEHWMIIPVSSRQGLMSIAFSGNDTGLAVGYKGTILRTLDAGQTWNIIPDIDTNLNLLMVCFPDHSCSYIMGYRRDMRQLYTVMLKSNDAGSTWDTIYPTGSVSSWYNRSFHFFDRMNGILVGGDTWGQTSYGFISKTVDGGVTWRRVFHDNYQTIFSVYFSDKNTGYAAGGYRYIGSAGIIIKTTNGGETWDTLTTQIETPLHDVCFTSVNTGFACGDEGAIYKTNDAGKTWTREPGITWNILNSLVSPDGISVYASGDFGTILKNANGGNGIVEAQQNSSSGLSIYPNPAGNEITIQIPGLIWHDDGQIILYEMTGRILSRIPMKSCRQKIDISSLPVGVYFVEYIHPDGTEIGKFIKN